jgi:hypothetical protein
LTLGLAILAAVTALGLALVGWRLSRRINTSGSGAGGVRRAAGIVSVISLLLVSISGLSHLTAGHPPSSPLALSPADFFWEHPALLTTAAVAVAALALLRIAKP